MSLIFREFSPHVDEFLKLTIVYGLLGQDLYINYHYVHKPEVDYPPCIEPLHMGSTLGSNLTRRQDNTIDYPLTGLKRLILPRKTGICFTSC